MTTWVTGSTAAELEDPIAILTDDGTKIGEFPAERHYIPYDALRGDARMGVTQAGEIFVALDDKLCSSKDGGRSWQSGDLSNAGGFGVIAHFEIRPFKCKPNMRDWVVYIAAGRDGDQ